MMAIPKWPHDHAEKHSKAAKLGWRRRRHLQNLKSGRVKLPTGAGHHTEKKGPSAQEIAQARSVKARYEEYDEKFREAKKRRDFKKATEYKDKRDALGGELDRAIKAHLLG